MRPLSQPACRTLGQVGPAINLRGGFQNPKEERFLAATRKRDEVLECYKKRRAHRFSQARPLALDYNELSISRAAAISASKNSTAMLAIDKAFQGYSHDLLVDAKDVK